MPLLGADGLAAGISPQAGPVAAVGAIEREAGVVAGPIRDRDEILVADAGAEILGAADVPDDTVGFAGLSHRHGAAIGAAAARIGAFDLVFAGRIGGKGSAGAEDQGGRA